MNSEVGTQESSTYRLLLVTAAAAFIVLPFITTFNELLTKVVERLQLVSYLQGAVAPFLAATVAGVLRRLFALDAAASGSYLYVMNAFVPLRIYVSWNCVGWQSLVLLLFTLATGLQGPYTLRSRVLCILLGVEGTLLVNVLRLLVPCLLAVYLGYTPAVVFHDYIGTILTLTWLALLWHLSYQYLLVRGPERSNVEARPIGEGRDHTMEV
ncbi:hypothetical protein CW700_01380 [Candidatus Bathyarchaeota archaeon]|nr:MAG: hypothetical protein CW700_01380 [Candidatus Bathyarchaeota archaeon]